MDIEKLRKTHHTTPVELDYVEFIEADDIWIKAYSVALTNTIITQHVHVHDHITLVSGGSIEAWQDGECLGQFNAPAVIRIAAGKKHAFKALTDNVALCCIHNLRGTGLESPEIEGVVHANPKR